MEIKLVYIKLRINILIFRTNCHVATFSTNSYIKMKRNSIKISYNLMTDNIISIIKLIHVILGVTENSTSSTGMPYYQPHIAAQSSSLAVPQTHSAVSGLWWCFTHKGAFSWQPSWRGVSASCCQHLPC